MKWRSSSCVAAGALVVGISVWLLRAGATSDDGPPAAAAPASDGQEAVGERAGERPTIEVPSRATFEDDPAGTLRLEGQVIDEEARPVGGALVLVDSRPPRTTVAAEDGSFWFDDLAGRVYTITARQGDRVGGPIASRLTDTSDPVIVRLRAGAVLRVTVVSADRGEPLGGSLVTLRGAQSATESTSDDGVATLRGVLPEYATLTVAAPGYAPGGQLIHIPDTPGAQVETRVALSRGAPVRGRVVDEDGAPVADALVTLRDAASPFSALDRQAAGVATDADGRFSAPAVAAGTHRLAATHPDFAPGLSAVILSDGASPIEGIEVVMPTGAVLAGRVVDAREQPVAWARIRVGSAIASAQPAGEDALREAVADAEGAFRVRGLRRAPVEVVAVSDAASSEVVGLDLERRALVEELVLRLTIDGSIEGIVLDGAGEPLPEVQVSAIAADSTDSMLRGVSVELTGGDGRFAFRGLPPGSYRLRASRGSKSMTRMFLSRSVRASTGERDVQIVVEDDGAIEGALAFVDEGAPPLFAVSLGHLPSTPVADPSGAFALRSVPPGIYDLTFRGPSFADTTRRAVAVEPGATTDLGTITVDRGRHLVGRVVDRDGAPIAGASVVAGIQLIGDGRSMTADPGMDDLLGVRRATTGSDGTFGLRGVGISEMMIAAEHPDHGRALPVTIPAGVGDPPPLELRLIPFGAVAGTVRARGEPAAAMIIATAQAAPSQVAMVTTGDAGDFVFDSLPAGHYRVTARRVTARAMLSSASSGGVAVTVVGGQRASVEIDLEVGDVTMIVTVLAEGAVGVDVAYVLVGRGVVSPADIPELIAQSLDSGAMMTLVMSGAPARFEHVIPGTYTVCVVPMADPAPTTRLEDHGDTLRAHCQRADVRPSPRTQHVEVTVPAMEPPPEN